MGDKECRPNQHCCGTRRARGRPRIVAHQPSVREALIALGKILKPRNRDDDFAFRFAVNVHVGADAISYPYGNQAFLERSRFLHAPQILRLPGRALNRKVFLYPLQ